MNRIFVFYWLITSAFFCLGQQKYTISGKVIETESGTPVPFANVKLTGTTIGTTTDFEGYYTLVTPSITDSIEVLYVGYNRRVKKLGTSKTQTIDFQLEESVQSLRDVIITAKKYKKKDNPAWPILRSVVDNKSLHDKRSLSAYDQETYTKIELDVNNITDKFRERKIVQKVTQVLDSIDQIAGDDGKPILPVFISEAISRQYYLNNPRRRTEKILKTKITGLGITDGTLTSQVIGGTLQEYNFYQNWLNIVNKEFISPIADGWRAYYEYHLVDSSAIIDNTSCYKIDFVPKRQQELAFWGTMWITKSEFALKRMDANVNKTANVNFVEKLKIQQDLAPVVTGQWLPVKSRVVVDVAQFSKKLPSLLAKFYVSAKDIHINDPKDIEFYERPVFMDPLVRESNDAYWAETRHDTLTSTEQSVYQMIDTLKKIPVIKTYTDIIETALTQYYDVPKFEIGPITSFYAKNDIEGTRLALGGRTSIEFSDKWELSGRLAYGFKDERFKYRLGVKRILDRENWTYFKYSTENDIQTVWLLNNGLENIGLLQPISRFGNLIEPFQVKTQEFEFSKQLSRAFTQKLGFNHINARSLGDFEYISNEQRQDTTSSFQATEVSIETRFAKDEVYIINDNKRSSLGTLKWPIIKLRYSYGIPNVLGSDFDYHKIEINISKKQKMGFLGISTFRINGMYIFNTLPYPLLRNHLGNNTRAYIPKAFNMMRFFEFTSDRFINLNVEHGFQGLILSKVPLIRKLKWRLVGSGKLLIGDLRKENLAVIPAQQRDKVRSLGGKPYIELGYGIENILKFIRVDAVHRLTHLNRPNTERFAIKVGFQLII